MATRVTIRTKMIPTLVQHPRVDSRLRCMRKALGFKTPCGEPFCLLNVICLFLFCRFFQEKREKKARENFSDRLPSLLRRSGAACGIRKQIAWRHALTFKRQGGRSGSGVAQRLWWLAAAQCARELEKRVENAHPRAPRRRPGGARIRCDKFRRIRRAQSSGSRRVATEFK